MFFDEKTTEYFVYSEESQQKTGVNRQAYSCAKPENLRKEKKEKPPYWMTPHTLMSALSIFPGRLQPSIVNAKELNYRVRNENGWTLSAINTDFFIKLYERKTVYNKTGDPYEIRTRVAGVRGRSLRPLDQRATKWYTIRDSNPGHPD